MKRASVSKEPEHVILNDANVTTLTVNGAGVLSIDDEGILCSKDLSKATLSGDKLILELGNNSTILSTGTSIVNIGEGSQMSVNGMFFSSSGSEWTVKNTRTGKILKFNDTFTKFTVNGKPLGRQEEQEDEEEQEAKKTYQLKGLSRFSNIFIGGDVSIQHIPTKFYSEKSLSIKISGKGSLSLTGNGAMTNDVVTASISGMGNIDGGTVRPKYLNASISGMGSIVGFTATVSCIGTCSGMGSIHVFKTKDATKSEQSSGFGKVTIKNR
jgi:hypothetical protein